MKLLNQVTECIDDEKASYLWGKMENEILLGKLDEGWKTMQELNDFIEKSVKFEEKR